MRRVLGIAAFLSVLVCLAAPAEADPFNKSSRAEAPPSAVLASLPPTPQVERDRAIDKAALERLLRRETAPLSTPIRFAGRCGSSNFYCNSPTPYCCGTGPANYYCAKDVNGCTR